MKKRLNVTDAKIIENKLFLEISESLSDLNPGGQILVDSDHFSFIYLLENSEDYTYVVIPEPIWGSLKEAHLHNMEVVLTNGEIEMELTHFLEELEYVISNIKGNTNYGKAMVEKIESIF
ncbi:hypothetical protein LRS37_02345 [Neobacillus sedimentimangrovi]|uniref:Uncharacterized protein n=1 Tax=Neobacillus sedimentimangrovi TaxID=2699460 RepID=A0ABS8QEU0_9BACI|nr:hypothetical protein [Neobacillus sedimentimangrovi]AIM17443.1 hypothetical protein HW35_15380 [Bacillus sp. X1(2014)]MCD4837735.1 hypothetical protein [Neobacillus sedimentimangrovi]